ncbi:thioredoxin domain-containing protein 3 [Ochotona curzoniae]|uniref:thioredoxin domain-containing protein 3 n=1 Tax=Ochotona curzoniae TaxID=130825 RepID=UPI001B34840C|nr:thioredoxin domain-containing protein 3 [Ochotona curzoniae]XP_040820601.1 thioredoxin domain-containing protein 3 [Ochotona curzoniae]
MTSKKREVQLQVVINSQSLWDEMLQNKGLTVIDVYQAWCGPCKAMQTLFRKLKNELNEEDILHFVVAEADSIATLQPFRDKCEPVFLFSLNGKIIAKIQGANAPLVSKKIINLINDERKIAAGEMPRPQYHEIALIDSEEDGQAPAAMTENQYTIVIIKPDAMVRKALEIKDTIANAGFAIEAQEKMLLTSQQVRNFYRQMEDQPDFEEFVSFMTSGVSWVLVLSQRNEPAVSWEESESQLEAESKDLAEGPPEAEDKSIAGATKGTRNSLQELLEKQNMAQFCDVERNVYNDTQLIDIFFPDFKIMKSKKLEKVLALLLPNLFEERKDDVLNIIEDEGFKILMQRSIVLSEEEAQTLCKGYENEEYFEQLTEYMTSGPSLALVLLRENGVQYWQQLLGPKTVEKANEYFPDSFCAQFAMGSLPFNQLYGSNSPETAEREIQYFFPEQNALALIKPHVTQEQREEILKLIKENGFVLTYLKEMVLTPEHVEKIYFSITGKYFYKDVLTTLTEGSSLLLILTKWNAIADWRRMMGPVDPEEATLLSPNSLRAQFGISKLLNAVHGASNVSEATEAIHNLFGDFIP